MHDELTIKIGSKDHKAFLQGGFYSSFVQRTPLHKHNYAEVHIVAGDAVEFQVGDSLYSSADGNLVIIPSGIYHCVTGKHPRCAIQHFRWITAQMPLRCRS